MATSIMTYGPSPRWPVDAPAAAHSSGDLVIEGGKLGIVVETAVTAGSVNGNTPLLNPRTTLAPRCLVLLPVPAGVTAGQKLYWGGSTANGTTVQPALSRAGATASTLAVGSPTTALTIGAATAGGAVDDGAHTYAYTWVSGTSESDISSTAVVTVVGTNQTIPLSAIAVGPAGTTARNVYRSKLGTTTPLFLLHTIPDNTTTTYSDTTADASLPATQPPSGTGILIGVTRDAATFYGGALAAPVELADYPLS